MGNALDRYLSRHAHCDPWALEGDIPENLRAAVVLPALAEYPGICATLQDLAAQPKPFRDTTLALVVVNNRTHAYSAAAERENNQELLAYLRSRPETLRGLCLSWVDAASEERVLPRKEGVGLARKIGMDHALARFAARKAEGLLISLDADARVDANYLSALYSHFAQKDRQASILPYAHPLDGPERLAILPYEIYMRYQRLMLHWAGSPYAYHALGSTLACVTQAYAAVGGMPRRTAGEDFYLLQKLAKHGAITRVAGTCVRPAARRSNRVPFGTGPSMIAGSNGEEAAPTLPHPRGYLILKAWFQALWEAAAADGAVMDVARLTPSPVLQQFLEQDGFAAPWARIRNTSPCPAQRWTQFHRYFDGLKTIRFQHYLRDAGYPNVPYAAGLKALADAYALQPPLPLAALRHQADATNAHHWEAELLWLRELEEATPGTCGVVSRDSLAQS